MLTLPAKTVCLWCLPAWPCSFSADSTCRVAPLLACIVVDVMADASKSCRDVLKRLLEAGWEAKAFDCLAALLKPRKSADKAPAAATAAAGSSAGPTTVAQQPTADLAGGPHVVGASTKAYALSLVPVRSSTEMINQPALKILALPHTTPA